MRVVQETFRTPGDVVMIISNEVEFRIPEETLHPARRGEDYNAAIIDAFGMSIKEAQREIIIFQD